MKFFILLLLPMLALATELVPRSKFSSGEKAVCIYQGVYSWSDGDEFLKNIPVSCKIIQATEYMHEFDKDYQMLEVDCAEGLAGLWGSGPGVGLVKNHSLNKTRLWYTNAECYKL